MERFYRKPLFCLLNVGVIFLLLTCAKEEKLSTIPQTEIPPSWTTLKKTLKPVLPPEPLSEEEIEKNKDKIGKFEFGDGEPHLLREDIAKKGKGGTRRSMLYFVHLSDVHIADEESPLRTEATMYEITARFSIQLLDAMMRTLNDFSKERPYDFIIFTGDSVDSSQLNEAEWFRKVVEGEEVDPDSGADDDPVPGPYNDFNDPFLAHGLDKRVPWYVVIGNHDCLIKGTIWPSFECALISGFDPVIATSDRVCGVKGLCGAQDGSTNEIRIIPAGEYTPPDERRRILGCGGFIEKLQGHGFNEDNIKRGYGNYVVDVGRVFRIIALDTICREDFLCGGLSSGCLERWQFEEFLIPELERAREEKKLVILTFHHFIGSFFPYSPVSQEELIETISSFPNLFLLLVGHGHDNRIIPHLTKNGGFWEIETSGLSSYPQQARIIEVVDNGDGTGSIFTTMVDHNSPDGSLSAIGREMSLREIQEAMVLSGDIGRILFKTSSHYGNPEDRNTELIFKIPDDIYEEIKKQSFPSRIESLTTLKGIDEIKL
jgi:hypothetical protein